MVRDGSWLGISDGPDGSMVGSEKYKDSLGVGGLRFGVSGLRFGVGGSGLAVRGSRFGVSVTCQPPTGELLTANRQPLTANPLRALHPQLRRLVRQIGRKPL